ncbi:MAG: hypothetical protein JNN00_01485 [Chitinophagaceae bacterium]|nr:hypothetical protein [Chitinophagaceae bacterium]
MKKVKILLPFLSLTLFVLSCGPKIYKSSEFDGALARHKTVAILPADVTMQLRPNEAKKLSSEQIADLTQKTGFDIQDKMYSWFLRRSGKFEYTVNFQDVNRTNALLKNAGISYQDLASKDRAEIAKILGVDAVLQNRSRMEKPMSEGAAVAVGVIFGAWGNTNKVETTINIHDGKSAGLLWKYDYEASGSVGSSTTKLVDALMRNASKKFPYSAK